MKFSKHWKKQRRIFQCLENRRAGFSLLEVLVALAIFGVAAGGVLVALGHHLKNVSFLQDHSRAVRIASREMNTLRRMTTFEEGETEGAEDRFSWVSQVTTEGLDEWPGLEDATGTPALLSVTVQWSDSEGGPSLGKVHLDGFDVFGAEQ
jgi:type II secretion system protein I